jgi:hypothetical protein
MRTYLLVVLTLFMCLLQGCATRWTKNGFSLQQWNVDSSNCMNIASANFPPYYTSYQSQGYTTPMRTNCNTLGSQVNCTTTGGQSNPITITQDLNEASRTAVWERCVRSKGYFPVGENTGEGIDSRTSDPIKDALTKVNLAQKARCLRAEFAPFYAKSPCDQGNLNLEQLADRSKPTKSEKIIISKIRAEEKSDEIELTSSIVEFGGTQTAGAANLFRKYTLLHDQVYLALYDGKYTYGQFNKRLVELREKFNKEMLSLL